MIQSKTDKSLLWWWIVAFAATLFVLYVLRAMLLPFVAGLALAYFLDPVADYLEKFGMRRTPAVLIITVVFMGTSVAILLLMAPIIRNQIVSLVHNTPSYIDSGWSVLEPYLELLKHHLPAKQVTAIENAAQGFVGTAFDRIGDILTGVLSRGVAVFSLMSLFVITPVVTIYLLRDWDDIVAKVNDWLPKEEAPAIRAIARDVDLTLAGFLRGQATVCLALATVYGCGLSFVGLEAGLLVGMATGFAAFIPYAGGITGFIVAMTLALFQFDEWTSIAGVIAVFAVGQVLEGYVLTPRLVGGRIGLHPVWVLFALLAGGTLFGFAGVLVALPVAAIIGVLVRHGLRRYLNSSAYLGQKDSPSESITHE